MNKTIIAIAAAMAVGGVTAQAKAPRGTSDAPFPYMPKARAAMQQDGFGRPDACQAKAPEGAVKVSALKTLTPSFLPTSSEVSYLNAPDGSTWFYTMDLVTEKQSEFTSDIKGFKLTVYDNELNVVGSVEDEIELGEGENRIAAVSIGPDLTRKFFNFDNSYEVMIGVSANTEAYVNNNRTYVYSLGKNDPIATFDGYYCSAINTAADAWSENFFITFITEEDTETPEVNGVVNAADYRFVTYSKAGYSGMGDPVLDVRFPMVCSTGVDAVPILATTYNGKPWISVSHLKYSWFENPYDATNENLTADNELIVDIYTPGTAYGSKMDKYSTTTIPLEATADDPFFLYHGNFRYDDDLNLTLSGDGTPSLYITRAHVQRGGDTFSYDYAVYAAAAKGQTAAGVKKFDLAKGVTGGTFMNDIPGFDPQVMFIMADGDSFYFQFVNVNNGEVEHELDAAIPGADKSQTLTETTNRVPHKNSYLYFAPQTHGYRDAGDNMHTQVVFVNPEDGSIHHIDDVNLGKDVDNAKLYTASEAFDPYLFNLDSCQEYMALVKRKISGSDKNQEELLILSTNPDKAPLLNLAPEEGKGTLGTIFLANTGTKAPKLAVMYMNQIPGNWQYTMQIYDLPLQLFEKGDGTAENPYEISTVGGLKQIISAPTAHYAIVNDIDASGYPLDIKDFEFTGSLDGRNHIISNLSLTGRALIPQLNGPVDATEGVSSNSDDLAGTVRNINFVNATLKNAASGHGLLVGTMSGGVIENVHAYTSIVQGDDDFGGLVGKARVSAGISGCSFQGDLIGGEESSIVGGIAGSTMTGATIQACAFKGNITAGTGIGGIVGDLGSNAGKISDCHVNATIKGKNTIGGIAATSGRSLIEKCHVQGSIEATEALRWGGGPCVGGIVGDLQPYYGSLNPDEPDEPATPSFAVQGCYVNLSSLAFTGTPAESEEFPGQNDTMHRIVGKSVVNNEPEPIGYDETTWEPIYSDEPVAPDAGLANNYAVATLTVGSDKIEAAATSTEGASVAADETGISFFQELGWNYGNDTENPWNMTGDQFNPTLYFEGGLLICTPAEVTVEAEKEVTLYLQLIGESITEDMAGDFTFEISDESVAEAGDMGIEYGEIFIVIKGLKEGATDVKFGIAGKQTQAKITVTAAESGIGSIEVETAGNISFNGNAVSAQGCAISVFSTTGTLVTAGNDTVSLTNVAGGIYIVTATDANGQRSSLKIRL